MEQYYIKFNQEKLEDSYYSIQLRYQTEFYDEYIAIRKSNDLQYCVRKIKKGTINNQKFSLFNRIKLYNILPVFDMYLDSQSLVSQDFDQFSLQNNLEGLTTEQIYYLCAVLSITLQELSFRQFPMIINERDIIILENHICLQQISFNFNKEVTEQESYQSYKSIVKNILPEFNEISFVDSTNYFLEKLGVYLGPSENMPYVELLDQIFEFQNVRELSTNQSNSYVYEFDTPDFMKTIPNISTRTVLKSLKLDLYETDTDYILASSQRELEIMENFKKYEPLVSCYAYFRVQKQLYLFMERYPQVLSNILDQIDDKRHCIELCCQLAVALKHLHKHSIIHRDLKPGNLFLTNEDLDRAQLYIADFDRSKLSQWLTQSISKTFQNESKQSNGQIENTVLGATPSYDPPESGTTNYDTRADIWQVGMIFYQIANKGVYPIQMTSISYTKEQYLEFFTKDLIKKQLQQYNIDQEFINIIAQCLQFKKEDRPTSDQLIQMLKKCFEESIIVEEEETLQSTHNFNQMNRFSELAKKTKTLKMLNSQEF